MKLPDRYQGPLGYEEGIDFLELAWTIRDWRDGKDAFGRLDDGEDVPATKVAVCARNAAGQIVEGSRFFAEKAKLIAVAEYAERVAKHEAAFAAIAKAKKLAIAAGMRYRDFYDAATNSDWAEFGGE